MYAYFVYHDVCDRNMLLPQCILTSICLKVLPNAKWHGKNNKNMCVIAQQEYSDWRFVVNAFFALMGDILSLGLGL